MTERGALSRLRTRVVEPDCRGSLREPNVLIAERSTTISPGDHSSSTLRSRIDTALVFYRHNFDSCQRRSTSERLECDFDRVVDRNAVEAADDAATVAAGCLADVEFL